MQGRRWQPASRDGKASGRALWGAVGVLDGSEFYTPCRTQNFALRRFCALALRQNRGPSASAANFPKAELRVRASLAWQNGLASFALGKLAALAQCRVHY